MFTLLPVGVCVSRDLQVAASVPPLDPGPRNTPASDWPNEEDGIRKAFVTGLPLGCSADFPLSFRRNDDEIVKDYESYGKKYIRPRSQKSVHISSQQLLEASGQNKLPSIHLDFNNIGQNARNICFATPPSTSAGPTRA